LARSAFYNRHLLDGGLAVCGRRDWILVGMAMDAHFVIPAFHIATTLAFAGIGACAGYLDLMLLSLNVRALLGQTRGAFAIAVPLARGAVTIAVFLAVALQGALPLVAALAGFLIARAVIVRHPETLLP